MSLPTELWRYDSL